MNDKFVFLLGAVLIMAVGVILSLGGFVNPELLRGGNVGKGAVILALTPQDISLSTSEGGSIDVLIDAKGEKVTVAELQFSFDPKVIHIEDISPGEFFKEPVVLQKEIQNGGGKAVFVIGGKEGVLGSGKIAKIKITGAGKGSSPLVFTRMTKVAAVDKVDSVLGKTSGALVNVR